MKILHITNAYPTENYSSFGIFIKEQIDSLNEIGNQNDVYFINARELGQKEYFRHIKKINAMSKKYDLIHCHHIYTIIPYLFSFSGKPYIVSLLNEINGIATKSLYLSAIVTAKRIIYKHDYKTDIKKMVYVPNGVNIDFFVPLDKELSKKTIGLNAEKKYALFVSASGPALKRKRYDKFEKLLELLKQKGIELQPLILAGVKRENVPFYFNASELLILTSDSEGSPNAVKEAMSCNLPVVSTDVGNVKRMLDGCNSSFVAESNTPEELADLAYKSLQVKVHNERDVLIQKKLDMKSVAIKLTDLYNEVIKTQ